MDPPLFWHAAAAVVWDHLAILNSNDQPCQVIIFHAFPLEEIIIILKNDFFFSISLQAYIDFEISEGEYERTRQLYERLLDRTKHLKVWISYAKFEAAAMEEIVEGADSLEEQKKKCIQNARSELL